MKPNKPAAPAPIRALLDRTATQPGVAGVENAMPETTTDRANKVADELMANMADMLPKHTHAFVRSTIALAYAMGNKDGFDGGHKSAAEAMRGAFRA